MGTCLVAWLDYIAFKLPVVLERTAQFSFIPLSCSPIHRHVTSHGLWGCASDMLTDYFLYPQKPHEVSGSPGNAETATLRPRHRGTQTHAQPILSGNLTAEVTFGPTERSGEL